MRTLGFTLITAFVSTACVSVPETTGAPAAPAPPPPESAVGAVTA